MPATETNATGTAPAALSSADSPAPADVPLPVPIADPLAAARAALDGTVLVPLTHLTTLSASGPDADAFLQGQLSNDLRALTARRAQLSSYSTPKGRVLALFTLIRVVDGSVLMVLPRSLAGDTLKRLRMFVLRSKLQLEDAGDRFGAIGLAGPEAADRLVAAGLPVPAADWETAIAAETIVVRHPGAGPRFSLHGRPAALDRYRLQWSDRTVPVDSGAWRLLEILAGQPSVHASTRERFVPQSLNLDAIGGISFDKGCYPGQEIVARLHYLGVPKRRMLRAVVAGDTPPEPGAAIRRRGGDGQAVGEVVDAAVHPDRGVVLLISVQLGPEPLVIAAPGAAGVDLDLTGIEPLIEPSPEP